jgi:hypothetical protein
LANASLTVNAVNDPPVVAALTITPDPASIGQTVSLTATGVADPFDSDGSVVSVAFYRESNGTAGLQTGSAGDTLVASDSDPADGWSAELSTVGLAAGGYTYYALAADNEGLLSGTGNDAASAANTVTTDGNLDIDGNGTADALTDGILILRYLFDPAGQWNFADAVDADATRTTRAALRAGLDAITATVLDVDGNGTADALTDGILILRYLFDPAGQWNFSDALGNEATRTTRAQLKSYLDQYRPAAAAASVLVAIDTIASDAEPTVAEMVGTPSNIETVAPTTVVVETVATAAAVEALAASAAMATTPAAVVGGETGSITTSGSRSDSVALPADGPITACIAPTPPASEAAPAVSPAALDAILLPPTRTSDRDVRWSRVAAWISAQRARELRNVDRQSDGNECDWWLP